jgi:hypothetical protein
MKAAEPPSSHNKSIFEIATNKGGSAQSAKAIRLKRPGNHSLIAHLEDPPYCSHNDLPAPSNPEKNASIPRKQGALNLCPTSSSQ